MTNLFATPRHLAVAMVQCEAIDAVTADEVERNADALVEWIQWCARAFDGIDLIVFPECSLQGSHPEMPRSLYATVGDRITKRLSDACAQHQIWAVFNVLEKADASGKHAYNVSYLVNHEGKVVLKQKKINPFVPTETSKAGEMLSVCKGPKQSTIGIMTCYDGDFPEVGRTLAVLGANVLLRPSSYMEPYSEPWAFVNRARAYENMAYVIAVNRAGITNRYNWFGNSMAVGYDGKIISQGPIGTRWVSKVDIDPHEVDLVRQESRVHNHLFNLKHRGYVDAPEKGDERNPYPVYQDWK